MKRTVLLICAFWVSLSPLCFCAENSSGLDAVLAPLAKAHQGNVAIAVENLATGESYFLNADTPMPTASLCKFPVLIEVYQQVAEGKVKLDDRIKVRKEDLVGGSGVLKYLLDPDTTISLREAVRLMIGVSDNSATNLVLDKIGIGATGKRMEAWGYPETKIHSKSFRGDTSVYPERSRRFGLGSTTANDMVKLLKKCHRGEIVSPEASKEIIATLRLTQDTERMTRYFVDNPGVSFAHKPGAVNNAKTDAGIMFIKGGPDIALCILTDKNKDVGYAIDNGGNVFIGKVTKAVYDYFTAKK